VISLVDVHAVGQRSELCGDVVLVHHAPVGVAAGAAAELPLRVHAVQGSAHRRNAALGGVAGLLRQLRVDRAFAELGGDAFRDPDQLVEQAFLHLVGVGLHRVAGQRVGVHIALGDRAEDAR
jgi:hypothetical protein